MDAAQYEVLKKKIEDMKLAINRAETISEQAHLRLKEAFGFETIEDAKKELEKKSAEVDEITTRRQAAYDELQSLVNRS